MNSFILLILGLLLVFLEFYLPGAIMGISGGLLILASMILFAWQNDSPLEIFLFILGALVSLAGLIKFALWKIRHTKPDFSIYSDDAQEGFRASSFDSSLVGKKGIVDTDLRPGGHILVDGKKLLALSRSGYITKGSEVEVIGGQEESLIVKLIKKDLNDDHIGG